RDFALMAARAEAGGDVEAALQRRVNDLRAHAEIMDARKAPGHLEAVIERLKAESDRSEVRHGRLGPDAPAELARRRAFLMRVAGLLDGEASEPEAAEAEAPGRLSLRPLAVGA